MLRITPWARIRRTEDIPTEIREFYEPETWIVTWAGRTEDTILLIFETGEQHRWLGPQWERV